MCVTVAGPAAGEQGGAGTHFCAQDIQRAAHNIMLNSNYAVAVLLCVTVAGPSAGEQGGAGAQGGEAAGAGRAGGVRAADGGGAECCAGTPWQAGAGGWWLGSSLVAWQ